MIILDLDHTLICAVYKPIPDSTEIFSRENGLIVLERPHAHSFLERIRGEHDIIVYTSALAWYAKRITKHFGLTEYPLYSRSSCIRKRDHYQKSLSKICVQPSESIIIVDDSPQYWEASDLETCTLLAPSRWMGIPEDSGLISLSKDYAALQKN